MTREEHNRLPSTDAPIPVAYNVPLKPVAWTRDEEINFDTLEKVVYHRARLWIRAETITPPDNSGRKQFVQMRLAMDRDILRSYTPEMLTELLFRQFVDAMLEEASREPWARGRKT